MDNSKSTENKISWLRIVVRHIVFFCLLFVVNGVLIFLIREPDKFYVYTATKAAKEKTGEINAVIFGSSHTAYGIDPMAFDEALGWTTFNAGTMLQDMQGAYYYLKDFNRNGEIEHVILNLSYSSWGSDYKNDTKALIILDRIVSPLVYAEYAFDTLSIDSLRDLVFVPYRYRSNATMTQMKENVTDKLNETYLYSKSVADGTVRQFPYMGFSPKSTSVKAKFRRIPSAAEWRTNEKSAENEVYLRKILEYCEEEGIEAILVSTPFTDSYVMQVESYDEIRAYFSVFAEEYDIPYYDYNMIQKDYFSVDPSFFWSDCHHMSFKGAIRFSKSFANLLLLAEQGEDVQSYFYDTFEEYVDNYDGIAGVRIRTRDLGGVNYRISITSLLGSNVEAEYQLLAKLEGDEEYQVIRDYSEELVFDWQVWEYGTYKIRVNARVKGSTKEYDVYNDQYELTMKSKLQAQQEE